MSTIKIDIDKCNKDKVCLQECPYGLIEEGPDGFPRLTEGGEDVCISCGHCLAVCPSGAVSLEGVKATDCLEVGLKDKPSLESVERLFRTRRSIRTYKKEPVDHALLERLLDLTRWAPTARNVQPVRWIVLEKPETVRELAGMVVEWMRESNILPNVVEAWDNGEDPIHRGAPHLIIAHCRKDGHKPVEDCTISVSTLETAAPSYGLGACWAGFFMTAVQRYAPLREKLELPEGHDVYAALMLGYPKYRYWRIPPRKELQVRWM